MRGGEGLVSPVPCRTRALLRTTSIAGIIGPDELRDVWVVRLGGEAVCSVLVQRASRADTSLLACATKPSGRRGAGFMSSHGVLIDCSQGRRYPVCSAGRREDM